MEFISILNDVLGPVMRGPSSSHTAGSYHIGRIARSLLGEEPVRATFVFDPGGSYAKTYTQQAADLGFAAGLMDWPLTDDRFPKSLELADARGIRMEFRTESLEHEDHPNTVKMRLVSKSGMQLTAVAKSVGGGGVAFTELEGWPVSLDGKTHDVFVLCKTGSERKVQELLEGSARFGWIVERLLEFRGLLYEREAHLFRTDREACDGAGFRAAFIDLRALGQIRCRWLRGKTRLGCLATTAPASGRRLSDCL